MAAGPTHSDLILADRVCQLRWASENFGRLSGRPAAGADRAGATGRRGWNSTRAAVKVLSRRRQRRESPRTVDLGL